MQVTGKVTLPAGKRVAVNIGCDFDAFTVWMTTFNETSQAYMSRGEYGAEVGVPRLLKLFEKHGVKASFCIPGHTADTFPDACRSIIAGGHEVVHHGYVHENPAKLSYDEEVEVIERGLESLGRLGVQPRGYRSPGWDFSESSMALLEKYDFLYDSSLMANDFYPYKPRYVGVNLDRANTFGEPSKIIELPVTWFLDDFPYSEKVNSRDGLRSPFEMLEIWKSYFDYAHDNCEGACVIFTTHPQTIGRPHNIQMLERLIEYLKGKDVWFATMEEIAQATVF
ncbi:MAG: polysaccharide deacetylase [Clostridiales bacterium]|nr:polysaccharide deacetylase [Clostridiales bacterium]